MKNGGAAHHTMKALRIIGITKNVSSLGEGTGRRPGIDCLEETEFCRKVVCALGIARTQIAADEMLTTT